MFEWITDPEAWVSLATLAALEIVLGIDNIIFISILVGRLPERQRQSGRIVGLGLAMITRILLLMSLAWMMKLTAPLFTVFNQEISGRDLILLIGGLFLIIKSSGEIKEAINHQEHHESESKNKVSYLGVLIQIAVLDIVFSLDSVITAVGMASHLPVMIFAIIIAVGVMMFAVKPIGDFVDTHPTLKILALAFLVLVGISLIAESLDIHIPKGYIYFAMGFSVMVEMINIRMRKRMK